MFSEVTLFKYNVSTILSPIVVYRVPLTKNRLQAPFVAHNYEYKRCPKGIPNW